jgi:hypothetical protein
LGLFDSFRTTPRTTQPFSFVAHVIDVAFRAIEQAIAFHPVVTADKAHGPPAANMLLRVAAVEILFVRPCIIRVGIAAVDARVPTGPMGRPFGLLRRIRSSRESCSGSEDAKAEHESGKEFVFHHGGTSIHRDMPSMSDRGLVNFRLTGPPDAVALVFLLSFRGHAHAMTRPAPQPDPADGDDTGRHRTNPERP